MTEPAPPAALGLLDDARARRASKFDSRPWGKSLAKHYPELTPATLHVAKHLALYADPNGRCWPGRKTLIAETRLSKRTVTNAIADLLDVGVIRQEPGSGSGHVVATYDLLPHADHPAPQGGNPSAPPRRRSIASQGGSPHARGDGSSSEGPNDEPPQPPASGGSGPRLWGDRIDHVLEGLRNARKLSESGRERDRDRGRQELSRAEDELRRLVIDAGLPAEHLELITATVVRGYDKLDQVVAELHRLTAWRQSPPDPDDASRLATASDDTSRRPGEDDQLSIFLDGQP